jgi:RES domain-containing protein
MKSPRKTKITQDETHRLIPYQYSDGGKPILNLLAQDDDLLLSDLTELEGATNARLLGESGKLLEITMMELVSGFPFAHVVNASFAHPRPNGGRFNKEDRGAWYAAFEIQTSQAEVAFYKTIEFQEVGWKDEEDPKYIDYVADFRHEFHDIREDSDFADCLDPKSHAAGQALGVHLLTSGSAGIVYPSVRHKRGGCIVCFRPPLVLNVQKGTLVTLNYVDGVMVGSSIQN